MLSNQEQVELLHSGLGFERSDALKIAESLRKLNCMQYGLMGGGLSGARLILNESMHPTKVGGTIQSKLFAALAAVGVGTAIVAGGCAIAKYKLSTFFERFGTHTAAIGALNPTLRQELRDEGMKILAYQQKIDDGFKETQTGPQFA